MDSLPQRVHIGSSGMLTSLQGFLTGWASWKILERQWGWSSRSATFLAGNPIIVWETDEGVGVNLPVSPVKMNTVTLLRGRNIVRVAGDTL